MREISLENFHLIIAISLPVARLMRSRSDRLVVDLDDVSHVRHWRKLTVNGFTPAAVGEVWNVCRFFFKDVVEARRYLATAVCSEEDRFYLERWGLKNVPQRGYAVSPVRDRRIDRGSQQFKLVFIGNMNYGPNRDAVVWFAKQVLPIIEESISDVAFDVIGGNATSDLISELHGRVTFRGFIDDLRDVLEHYDVSVAPIRFGGGTKLKVLEAMSIGLPVVTTPVGAEGLGLSSEPTL